MKLKRLRKVNRKENRNKSKKKKIPFSKLTVEETINEDILDSLNKQFQSEIAQPNYSNIKQRSEKELNEWNKSVFLFADAAIDMSYKPNATESSEEESEREETVEDESIPIEEATALKPAWVDNDDDPTLSVKYQDIHKKPKWAEISSSGNSSVVEVKKLLSDRITENLQSTYLSYNEMNGFYSSKSKGKITHLTFSTDHPLALVCHRLKGTGFCALFQVDGEHNYEIQSISFEKFPVTHAAFIDMKRFVVVSRAYSWFFVYNLANGSKKKFYSQDFKTTACLTKILVSPNREKLVFLTNENQVHIYNAKTITHITTAISDCKVKDAAFHVMSSQLYVYCANGFVLVYDINLLRFVNKFYDDGCVEGMCIALAPNSKYIACGSNCGIVNLYDTSKLENENPTPIKTFRKILTTITTLAFNSTSEILFMSSSASLGATRMAHVHSLQTFKNYPSTRTTPRPILGADFSPRSAYLGVVKPEKIELFRLKHYVSY